ncbi:hypothetical protein AAVH_03314 [Aphelenchoides avenae]|nr:hypothetical protein AAVH_03314 [Aphelenchus avenae]
MASDSEDDYLQKIDGDTVAENIAQSITNILVESTNEEFKQALHEVTQSRSSEEFKNTVQTRLDTFLEADAKRIASARLSKQSILVKTSEHLKSRVWTHAFKRKYKKQESSVLMQSNNSSLKNQLESDDFSDDFFEAAHEWDDGGDGFTSSDFDMDSDSAQPVPARLLREQEVKCELSSEAEFTDSEDGIEA